METTRHNHDMHANNDNGDATKERGGGGRWGLLGVGTAACVAVLAGGPSAAGAAVRDCVHLKGAAAQMYDQKSLCRNVEAELGKSMTSGKPMNWDKALGNSVKGAKSDPANIAPFDQTTQLDQRTR